MPNNLQGAAFQAVAGKPEAFKDIEGRTCYRLPFVTLDQVPAEIEGKILQVFVLDQPMPSIKILSDWYDDKGHHFALLA